ncbi:MAG: PepSY-associated TM helix domain-containing protein [Pseudomonadota bacterium]|nr:PepSY-associated TM helix domain-containing protein [Pseudomonadota bacterium]
MSDATTSATLRQQRRGFWLRQLHQWHWISAAVCLVAMLLFSVTGITLNHAASIEATAQVAVGNTTMPTSVLKSLSNHEEGQAPLSATAIDWLNHSTPLRVGRQAAEWSADEIYLALPRPGGDGWISIDRKTGAVEYERTGRGWVSYLNDLHKGRHTGAAWRWFIDVFAIASIVFTASGLFLLQMHARQRRSTWPWVALGVVIPLIIALVFIH